MSSAAVRAEARRKAILGRSSDRLSKLTSSARGEDHPVYSNVADTTSRNAPTTETFVGEESFMPTPPLRPSPSPEPSRIDHIAPGPAGPSAWTDERQQEFLRALMSTPEPNRVGAGSLNSSEPDVRDDAMAGILNAFTQMAGQAPLETAVLEPRSLFSKLRPLLHLLASWALIIFFAFFTEPQVYGTLPDSRGLSLWDRWAHLAKGSPKQSFGVQPVSFFWAFVTLQLMLHAIQIFTNSNPIQPPTLLAAVLPSLPPKFRTAITNFLVYARMGGMLLDDVAGLVFGLGILIWSAAWIASGR